MTRDAAWLALGALCCVAVALGIATRDLGCPGLYYDEVIQAEPAVWFLRAEPAPPEVPGEMHARLFGRPFPLMTQPYMGALKSQLLVPVFAAAGADTRVLRLATLGIGVLGLAAAMLFAWRAFGLGCALCCGALLAVDPSFLFVSRHDWGSFATSFLLRCLALLLLFEGWRSGSRARLFAGGLAAGLCIYNKVDAVVPFAAAGAALLWSSRGWLRALRRRGTALLAAGSGLALGAAPVLLGLLPALAFTLAAARAGMLGGGESSEWAEKWSALLATLDGSYFERLMRAGGSFERLALQSGTATPFLALFLLASVVLAVLSTRAVGRGSAAAPIRFALLAAWLSFAGILVTPHAVRIHHYLNAWPFPQLVVALAAQELWRLPWRGRTLARGAVAVALAAALLGALRADRATLASVRASCGSGRWSDAITRAAPELAAQGVQVVCLDWGFAGPLRFTWPDLWVREPIWSMRSNGSAVLAGGSGQVYLLFEPKYAVFPYGPALLDAISRLPPGAVTLHRFVDRRGDTAFVSLRFAGPHRLVVRGDHVEVVLR